MATLRSIRRALGHLDPVLIDGIVALIVLGLMAGPVIGRHLQAGQHPMTPLAWTLAVLIVAPILTHRRFPRASLAVCLTALVVYAAGRYVASPVLAVFVLTFDITLHSRRRVALAALLASAGLLSMMYWP